MTEIRRCGVTGWAYCDGDCNNCHKHTVTTTNTAMPQILINPYNNHPICPYCGRDLQGVIKDNG